MASPTFGWIRGAEVGGDRVAGEVEASGKISEFAEVDAWSDEKPVPEMHGAADKNAKLARISFSLRDVKDGAGAQGKAKILPLIKRFDWIMVVEQRHQGSAHAGAQPVNTENILSAGRSA